MKGQFSLNLMCSFPALCAAQIFPSLHGPRGGFAQLTPNTVVGYNLNPLGGFNQFSETRRPGLHSTTYTSYSGDGLSSTILLPPAVLPLGPTAAIEYPIKDSVGINSTTPFMVAYEDVDAETRKKKKKSNRKKKKMKKKKKKTAVNTEPEEEDERVTIFNPAAYPVAMGPAPTATAPYSSPFNNYASSTTTTTPGSFYQSSRSVGGAPGQSFYSNSFSSNSYGGPGLHTPAGMQFGVGGGAPSNGIPPFLEAMLPPQMKQLMSMMGHRRL